MFFARVPMSGCQSTTVDSYTAAHIDLTRLKLVRKNDDTVIKFQDKNRKKKEKITSYRIQ